MANKFTDYDMRRFAINDTKDVYAFFEAVTKGLEQTRTLVKKMNISNSAQAGVIRSLQKKLNGPTVSGETAEDTTYLVQDEEARVDQTKESAKNDLIQKLRAVEEGPESDGTPAEATAEDPAEAPVEDPAVDTNPDSYSWDGYKKVRGKKGFMYYGPDNRLTKAENIPEKTLRILDDIVR